ncbi:MAG: mechanosensitive ion channel [Crocinitomicaceae bacterium]|nr:mechanosensitive ion channel [Crocinitomicaceae bacterium]
MPFPSQEISEHVSVDRIQRYTEELVDGIVYFLPKLAFALLTLVAGLWIIRRIAVVTVRGLQKKDIEPSLRSFIQSLLKISLKVLLIVMVAGMLGIQTTSFVALLGAAGLAVGLALQGSLANFAGGVLILLFKPYKVDDDIEVGGQLGQVSEIQIFNTILVTRDGKTVILPNGSVSNQTIINHSRYGSLRVSIQLQFPASADIEMIRKVILENIGDDLRVLKQPAPLVIVTEIGAGNIKTQVRFFAQPKLADEVKADIQERIIGLLASHNVALGNDSERIIINR